MGAVVEAYATGVPALAFATPVIGLAIALKGVIWIVRLCVLPMSLSRRRQRATVGRRRGIVRDTSRSVGTMRAFFCEVINGVADKAAQTVGIGLTSEQVLKDGYMSIVRTQ